MKNTSKILIILSLILSTSLSNAGLSKPLIDTNISFSDNTTNNVSTTKHGFTPKSPNDATKYLDGTGAYTIPAGGGGAPLAYTTIGGTVNAITLTPSPVITSYASAVGQRWLAIATGTNTTATVTVNINGLGALNAYQGSVVVPIGGIISGNVYWFLLDTATTVRISPYDAVSVQGDTLNGQLVVQGITVGAGDNGVVGNSAFGISSLVSATGANNTAIGRSTGSGITTGTNNTAVWANAGGSPGAGSNNTLIGYGADVNNGNSTYRIAIGSGALSGTNNAAIIGGNAGIGSNSVRVGINMTSPTSILHLPAGTATVNTAPLKFTSGTDLTTPETGSMEYDGSNLHFTPATVRQTLVYTNSTNPMQAPVVLTGFGDVPAITSNNGTHAFILYTGIDATTNDGVLTLPTSPNGWICNIVNSNTTATTHTRQEGISINALTLRNYILGTLTPSFWAGEILGISCIAL